MSSRVRLLLAFAAMLAALRIMVVPWIAGQADTRDRLYAITRQLDRAEAIVETVAELQARRDALAAVVAGLAARAPLASRGIEHRLQVQRELRAVVEAAGLQLQVFEWILDDETATAGLAFGRVRLQLAGTLRGVAEAHVSIEAGLPHVFVRDLTVNVRRGGQLATAASATMELDLYYRSEEGV